MTRPKTLRDAIRRALHRKRLTLTELGKLSGLDRTTLSRFLNGKADLKSYNLDRVLVALNIDLTAVLESDHRRSGILSQAFEALGPLQKKTLLKTIAQALRYSSTKAHASKKETLAGDLDQWRCQLKLVEGA